jgi:S-adenosylmethionine:tRNA ribosyltransferase-isomerase
MNTFIPFTYDLPEEKIAQRPVYPAHCAQLLVVDRSSGAITSATYEALPELLPPTSTLVFNNTKVLPARIFAANARNKGEVEIVLLSVEDEEKNSWKALMRPLRRLKNGDTLIISGGCEARFERREDKYGIISFPIEQREFITYLWQHGRMPIPPYIRQGLSDEQDAIDYQTIFAKKEGSVAAPTASLHFSPELMGKLSMANFSSCEITLHVGGASIEAVWDGETLRAPATERFFIEAKTVSVIDSARHITAVGTTSVRALESYYSGVAPGDTSLFITPGYEFKRVNSLITNFHQPGTTHLLLVESFMGRELLKECYDYALKNNFRFLSYGDGMLIL